MGVHDQIALDALAALHGRDDPQAEIRAGGVVVVSRDGRTVDGRVLTDGHDRAGQSALREQHHHERHCENRQDPELLHTFFFLLVPNLYNGSIPFDVPL